MHNIWGRIAAIEQRLDDIGIADGSVARRLSEVEVRLSTINAKVVKTILDIGMEQYKEIEELKKTVNRLIQRANMVTAPKMKVLTPKMQTFDTGDRHPLSPRKGIVTDVTLVDGIELPDPED